ncbi:hypothetical protein [Duganella sp. FT27W]|uniref:DUF5983 family protein n=1 Tax=Duganella sp. FT27W TaxID=2654636 RepID=UPI00128E4588|nr:hypothetical protein [Duganella sp. FT27W]MPQ56265.1 hypothetical protein [Duganella sp. FT27W]
MIYTYLDLSTGHLSQKTKELLDEAADRQMAQWPAMTIAKYSYGYFVTVPDLGQQDVRDQATWLRADLRACLQYAHKQGIHMLRFDAEGDQVDGLEVFDE